jgi:hypothetical protein
MLLIKMPAEFEKMVSAIKTQFKKDNPNLSDEEITSKAYAIATANWKKTHNGKGPNETTKLDSDGNIIVGENVKLILEANITSTGNIIDE